MDEDVKRQFDSFCSEVGMNASVAVNMFAKTVVREKRIPFEITTVEDPFFSATNQAYLKRSYEQLRSGRGTVHEPIED
jgi:DNA-damage-inducible protein J